MFEKDDTLRLTYEKYAKTPSDINEHLPTLFEYTKQCQSVLELGVRGVVSTWAFAYGLSQNQKQLKHLFCNDVVHCDLGHVTQMCRGSGIDVDYKWCSDLELDLEHGSFDLVFIDTFHVYGQLKRELQKFRHIAQKYIIMHDTTIDAVRGEAVRMNMNIEKLQKQTGFTKEELVTGLKPAIDEFLESSKEWVVRKVFTNNNGLTILERVRPPPLVR